MKRRIARTPVEPFKTFYDDPLRILRTIRFAQRYDLTIAPEIYDTAHNSALITSFEQKLSNERVTSEMNKIFSIKNSHIAI